MQIINCGYNYRHPKNFKINRPNGSGDYILLVLRSPAFFVFEGQRHYTKCNSVVIFKKGTPQIYGAFNSEFVNDWVHFEADQEDIEYFKSIDITFDKIMEFQNVTELSKLIRKMCFEKYSNNKNFIQSANLYFNLIMLKISDLCERNHSTDSALSNKLVSLRNEIYTNPQTDWTVDKIAGDLFISVSYLQHQYKLLFNNGIKRDITLSRMEYGKYLLFNTDYTVATISRLCGYENDVHFMRTFKKETGVTPTKYRAGLSFSREKVKDSKNYNPFSL